MALGEAAATVQSVGGTVYVGLQSAIVMVDVASGAVTPLPAAKPPFASLSRCGGDEVLVTWGQQTLFMGDQSKRLRRGRTIAWTNAPSVVHACPPYIVGVGHAGVEVQLMDPFTDGDLRQMLALQGAVAVATHTSKGGAIVLLSSTGVARLVPVSARVQAQEMLRLKEHEEALMLAGMMPKTEVRVQQHCASPPIGEIVLQPEQSSVTSAGERPPSARRPDSAGLRAAPVAGAEVRGGNAGVQHEPGKHPSGRAPQLSFPRAAPAAASPGPWCGRRSARRMARPMRCTC